MGYLQEARENHVKKKVEEGISESTVTAASTLNPNKILCDKNGDPLRSKMKQKALKECDRYTLKYAECASGRTISVVWQCRKQAKELNKCLHQFTNDAILEEMKKDYMLQQEGKGTIGV